MFPSIHQKLLCDMMGVKIKTSTAGAQRELEGLIETAGFSLIAIFSVNESFLNVISSCHLN